MWGDDPEDYRRARIAAAAMRAEDGLPVSIVIEGVRVTLQWIMVGHVPYPVAVKVLELRALQTTRTGYVSVTITGERVEEIEAELLLRYWQNCVPLERYEAIVPYVGLLMRCRCDGKCSKAWGWSMRPASKFGRDGDPVEYYADQELGEAPSNPGTAEGGSLKPSSPDQFPTKWCVRECERCNKSDPFKFMDSLPIIDWSKRQG